jgi:hypothetical protein
MQIISGKSSATTGIIQQDIIRIDVLLFVHLVKFQSGHDEFMASSFSEFRKS